jgi:hypothetical protein
MTADAPQFPIPPYGQIADRYLDASRKPPARWQSAKSYPDWCFETLRVLVKELWPAWKGARGWVGRTLHDMHSLSLADLELMKPLMGLQPHPAGLVRTLDAKTEAQLFFEEDEGGKSLDSYALYDPAAAGFEAKLKQRFTSGLWERAGATVFYFKENLQRPRPNTYALLADKKLSKLLPAESAHHPSMISGHALQGLFGAAEIMLATDAHRAGAPRTTHGLDMEALAQFAVDFGDRRVIAGVHYPSDNLASWYVALSLVEHVYTAAEATDVRAFMRRAIKKSRVFREVTSARGGPYTNFLSMLYRLLEESVNESSPHGPTT